MNLRSIVAVFLTNYLSSIARGSVRPARSPKLPIILALFCYTGSLSAATLLQNDFGNSPDVGPSFQELWNGQGGGANSSADTSSGVISILSTASDNTSIGLNTSNTVDASGVDGFTITWNVTSFTGDLNGSSSRVHYNGWFFGFTTAPGNTGSNLWNNASEAVGILLDGGINYPDWRMVQRTGATISLTNLNGSQASAPSMQDGFSLSMTVNADDTWSASSTGLSNNIDTNGSLVTGTYLATADSVVANTSIQGTNLSYDLNSVSITSVTSAPEPSSMLLASLGCLGLVIRRRR